MVDKGFKSVEKRHYLITVLNCNNCIILKKNHLFNGIIGGNNHTFRKVLSLKYDQIPVCVTISEISETLLK